MGIVAISHQQALVRAADTVLRVKEGRVEEVEKEPHAVNSRE